MRAEGSATEKVLTIDRARFRRWFKLGEMFFKKRKYPADLRHHCDWKPWLRGRSGGRAVLKVFGNRIFPYLPVVILVPEPLPLGRHLLDVF